MRPVHTILSQRRIPNSRISHHRASSVTQTYRGSHKIPMNKKKTFLRFCKNICKNILCKNICLVKIKDLINKWHSSGPKWMQSLIKLHTTPTYQILIRKPLVSLKFNVSIKFADFYISQGTRVPPPPLNVDQNLYNNPWRTRATVLIVQAEVKLL